MRHIRKMHRIVVIVALAICAVALLPGCSESDKAPTPAPPRATSAIATIQLTSPEFDNGSEIPTRFTCDGDDISPELTWTGVPNAARSLALIVDDPDAPRRTWIHWVVYGLPSDASGFPEGASIAEHGGVNGATDFNRSGYGGPCPPSGPAHRYFFKLYALDAPLSLDSGSGKSELLSAMDGHTIAQGILMGIYAR